MKGFGKESDGEGTEDELKQSPCEKYTSCIPARYSLAVLLAVGLCLAYFLRFNLSQAMVAMVTQTNSSLVQNVTGNVCPRGNITESNHTKIGEFDWDEKTQGIILGSFFYGYVLLQIPGGWLSTRFGAKWPIGISILLQSVLTLLTPLAARTGVWLLITVRAIEGFCGGALFPSVHGLLGQWTPPNERSKLLAIMGTGPYTGTVLAFVSTGWLSENGFAGGWPSAFYLPGIGGCVWFIFWAFFAFSSPKEHPRISTKERDMITTSLGYDKLSTEKPTVPWGSLLTSRPAWAINVAFTCSAWGSYTLMTELPTYMKNVLWLDISQSGFLSSLPFLVSLVVTYVWGFMTDFLLAREHLSTTAARKLMNTIASLGPAVMLVTVNFVGCNPYIVIMVISFSVSLQNAEIGSVNPNMIDLAPRLAGMTKSIANTMATLTGIAAPYITGLIINKQETKTAWATVFYITASIFLFDWIIYSIFASGEEQPWSRENMEIEEDSESDPLLDGYKNKDLSTFPVVSNRNLQIQ